MVQLFKLETRQKLRFSLPSVPMLYCMQNSIATAWMILLSQIRQWKVEFTLFAMLMFSWVNQFTWSYFLFVCSQFKLNSISKNFVSRQSQHSGGWSGSCCSVCSLLWLRYTPWTSEGHASCKLSAYWLYFHLLSMNHPMALTMLAHMCRMCRAEHFPTHFKMVQSICNPN